MPTTASAKSRQLATPWFTQWNTPAAARGSVVAVMGYALRESVRRRVFAVVLVLTLVFLILYALGVRSAFRDAHAFAGGGPLAAYLADVHAEVRGVGGGEVATYIPELAKANPDWFGIALAMLGVYLAYHWEGGRLTVAGHTKVKP